MSFCYLHFDGGCVARYGMPLPVKKWEDKQEGMHAFPRRLPHHHGGYIKHSRRANAALDCKRQIPYDLPLFKPWI
jgi:hypothetical protein